MMIVGIYSLFFLGFVGYHFFISPKIGSAIASFHGKDPKRWHFYIWAFGIFGIFYLYLSIEDLTKPERNRLILLMGGYVLIFIGAILLDAQFSTGP